MINVERFGERADKLLQVTVEKNAILYGLRSLSIGHRLVYRTVLISRTCDKVQWYIYTHQDNTFNMRYKKFSIRYSHPFDN